MDKAKEDRIRERLAWVDVVREGIIAAVGSDVIFHTFQVRPTTDPLKFIMRIPLLKPLAKETRQPLRVFIRQSAKGAGCVITKIYIGDREIRAEVSTKTRYWHKDSMDAFKNQ